MSCAGIQRRAACQEVCQGLGPYFTSLSSAPSILVCSTRSRKLRRSKCTRPHHTAPGSIGTTSIDRGEANAVPRAAFRNLHGARLYGFALILAMGERQWAAQAAAQALAEGEQRLPELRHPERAAAWLRRRVVKQLQRPRLPASLSAAERFRALSELGVGHATKVGLDALSVSQRAALVASDVERFSPVDVEQILGRRRGASDRLIQSARRRFLAAVADEMPGLSEEPGPIAKQVDWEAARVVRPVPAR